METIYLEKTTELKRAKRELEKKLNVKIEIQDKEAIVEGDSLDEYEAIQIIEAISFGFSASKALLLKEPEYAFRKLHIGEFSGKRKLTVIKSRLIGRHGKTKKTIEDVSNSYIIIQENEIGIISPTESIEFVITALINLMKGTKESNIYRYLEKINKTRREEDVLL